MSTNVASVTQPISIFLEDQATTGTDFVDNHYDLSIILDPSTQYLPFEPFITIIRFAFARLSEQRINDILTLPNTFAVLRPIIVRYLTEQEPGSREPLNPDEMAYEQVEILKAMTYVLRESFAQHPGQIAIINAQNISASAFEWLQQEDYRMPGNLQLDFYLTTSEFQNLKIAQGFVTQIKRRHLSAPLSAGINSPCQQRITLAADTNQYWSMLRRAISLFSPNEMLLLANLLEQGPALDVNQMAELKMARMYAWVLLRDAERCHIYIQELQRLSLQDLPVPAISRTLKAICVAHLCLQEYSLAEKALQRYRHFSMQEGRDKDSLLAEFYEFLAQCFNGNMRSQKTDIERLESQLQEQGWFNLAAFVKCSLWFNERLLEDNADAVIRQCLSAVDDYKANANVIGQSTAHHHVSIVLGATGHPQDAIRHINRALKLTQLCGLSQRIHNTLNGLAFLLNGLGQTEPAKQALETAYPLALADGNFDQICTTLYNLALVAFYADYQQTTIQLLDDIFSVMEYRNMTSTRFRTKGELLALQAIAAYINGDRRLPAAIRPQIHDEPPRSNEGEAFIRCLGLITQSFNADEAEHFFMELTEDFAQLRQNLHLELLALRLLVIYLTDLGEAQRALNWAQLAIRQTRQYHLESRECWFRSTATLAQKMNTSVEPRQAISMAQRQMGIDALKLENGLLNTLAAFHDSALRCANVDELIDSFLANMQRLINVNRASLSVQFVNGHSLCRDVENPWQDDQVSDIKHLNFDFQFIGGQGQLDVSFLGDIINRSVDAKNIIRKICQQLSNAIEFVLDRLDSYRLAYHDPLTQVYNRTAFDEDMTRLLQQMPSKKVCLAFIDLDNFKKLNDTFGHSTGDQFLQQFVQSLSKKVRAHDRIYRIGGDEFLVSFQDVNRQQAEEALQRFIDQFFAISELARFGNTQYLNLGCSIGIIEYQTSSTDLFNIDTLLARADHLMYQAKRSEHEQIVSDVFEQID